MIKNIMGVIIAAAVAVGAGTTGVKSNTSYNANKTQIVKSAKTTTLSDYHSNVAFTKSSDIKKISNSYHLKDSSNIDQITYIPVNDYSANDASGQTEEVSVETRLASYSIKKQGYKDQTSFVKSKAVTAGSDQNIHESAAVSYDFSNMKAIAGENSALKSCLSSAYDFSISKKSVANESIKISPKNDATLNVYVIYRTYDYQLWESDLSHDVPSDNYLGNGTIKRPLGVIVTVNR